MDTDITQRHVQMITPGGFDELFDKEIGKSIHKTYKDAFDALNREYFEAFGSKRYSNYLSYRITRRERRVTKT